MPECSYCGAEFDDEEAELRHLADEHRGELGRIDRRRVADVDGGGGDGRFAVPTGPAILVGVIGFSLAIVIYIIVFMNPGGASAGPDGSLDVPDGIGQAGSTHEHGTIEMVVLGDQVDFSRAEYQRPREVERFHFEGGDGDVWHKHATGVTLGWAMETLGIEVTGDSVTFEGTTYRDSDPDYDVEITVNGEPVEDPDEYVLDGVEPADGAGGDHVSIVVSRTNESG